MKSEKARLSDDLSVSVVIPCYNVEGFIGDALKSVYEQIYPAREIICVDDGSTDNTLYVLRSHQRQSIIPFRVISHPNAGPSAARNAGLELVTGDWIQFLDADDFLHPEKLHHQATLINKSGPRVGLVAAAYNSVTVDGATRQWQVATDAWMGLFTARLGITSANLWRTDAVVNAGGWNSSMHTSEDPDLMFRIMANGYTVTRDECALTTLMRRPDSQWNRDLQASYQGWFEFRRRVYEYMQSNKLIDYDRHLVMGDKVWSTLRRIENRDPEFALEMYKYVIQSKIPMSYRREALPLRTLYNTIGFRHTRRLRVFVNRVRSSLARVTAFCIQ